MIGTLRGEGVGEALRPVALYVHVPFCVSHCPYCDFVVYAGAEARGARNRIDVFVRALIREIELRADALDASAVGAGSAAGSAAGAGAGAARPLDTVYIGGGTPSLLPPESLAAILETVRRRFGIAADAEVTLEANPSEDERGDAAAFVRAGVTRFSFGAQSLDPAELPRIGRRHSPEDVAAAVGEARAAGAASVSLDLLYDLPGQTLASWEATLDRAIGLRPDHLSLYALTLEDPDDQGLTGPLGDHLPTPPGARRWRERTRREQDDDRAAEQYMLATRRLADVGWHGYEISNWARPGHESRHNLVYWRRLPYEAVGPGAHAFDGTVRRWNAARFDAYLGALLPADGAPVLPPGGHEVVEPEVAAAERLVLALRLDDGIPAAWAADPATADVFAWGIEAGLLESVEAADGARLRLTVRGRLLSNELFARLV